MRVRHKLIPEYGEGIAKNWRFGQSVEGGPIWTVLVQWPNHPAPALHRMDMLRFRVPAGRRYVAPASQMLIRMANVPDWAIESRQVIFTHQEGYSK